VDKEIKFYRRSVAVFFSLYNLKSKPDSEPTKLLDHPKKGEGASETDKHLPQSPFTVFVDDDILLAVVSI
jgi:hypothetical protein